MKITSPDGKVIRFSKGDGLWGDVRRWKGCSSSASGVEGGCSVLRYMDAGRSFLLFQVNGQIWALDEQHILFRRPSLRPPATDQWTHRLGCRQSPARTERGSLTTGPSCRGELTRIDVKTGGPLNPSLAEFRPSSCRFLRTGTLWLIVTYPEGILWQANRDGSNRVELTTSASFHVLNPRWIS